VVVVTVVAVLSVVVLSRKRLSARHVATLATCDNMDAATAAEPCYSPVIYYNLFVTEEFAKKTQELAIKTAEFATKTTEF